MESSARVYIGPWTNWGEGPIKGAKITLTDAGGAYLIAFLALFVQVAGSHSWGILCYLRSKYLQRRASSNNGSLQAASQSPSQNTSANNSTAWHFLSFSQVWRSFVGERLSGSLAWKVFAASHALAFVFAGIFISNVAESGSSEVLLRGPICGVWQDPAAYDLYSSGNLSDAVANNQWSVWFAQGITAATNYARDCYNVTSPASTLANCNAFAPRLIEWNATTDAKCPFDSKMCREDMVVSFDSGLLDSLHHFGVNANAPDRVKYRRVVECSPLVQEGFVSGILNVSQVDWPEDSSSAGGLPQQNGLFQEYRYGPNFSFNMTSTYIWSNFTFTTTNWGDMDGPTYMLDQEQAMLDSSQSSSFAPIEELNRTDADVVLNFLVSNSRYIEPVKDPWFQATTPYVAANTLFANEDPDSLPVYLNDYNVSVLGCTQQFQYCNHDGSKCSKLTGSGYGGSLPDSVEKFSNGLDLNVKQSSTLDRLVQASWNADMYTIASFGQGGGNLLADGFSTSSYTLPRLPDNQWILEMQHHFLAGLTSMQMQMAAYVIGPSSVDSYQYITTPTADERWMCTSQIVQRSEFSTFSVLGMVIVIVVGLLLVLINLSLHAGDSEGKVGSHVRKDSKPGKAQSIYHRASRALYGRNIHDTESMYQLTATGDSADRRQKSDTWSTMSGSPRSTKRMDSIVSERLL